MRRIGRSQSILMRYDLANEPENECLERLRQRGYEATKRGWPDFLAFRPDGELVVVEVKARPNHRLKASQLRVMAALMRAGIECYRFDPISGFSRLRIAQDGAVEVDDLTDKNAAGLRVVNPAALVAPPAGDASTGNEDQHSPSGVHSRCEPPMSRVSGAPDAAVGAKRRQGASRPMSASAFGLSG